MSFEKSKHPPNTTLNQPIGRFINRHENVFENRG